MARGRPKDPEQQEKVRAALLNAMRELLGHKSYRSISIREIAEQAGTYSAMISYYFESKEGLVKALLLRTASERQTKLAAIAQEVVANPEQSIDVLVNRVLTLLLKEPWLFRLFQDELMNNNEALRSFFLEHFAQVVISGLRNLFQLLQQNQIIRQDINLQFLVPTFMGLISFPIMALPLLEEAAGIDLETIGSAQWQSHISQFLTSHLVPSK